MVSNQSMIAIIFTLILSFVFPIVLFVFLRKGHKGVTGAFFAGALGFFVTQIVIRIPILQMISFNNSIVHFAKEQFIIYGFILAFTAGLFETVGRLFVFKLILKNKTSYRIGLAAGAGHGCIETIYLTGLTYINNLIYSIMINKGTLVETLTNAHLSQEKISELVDALTNTKISVFYLVGFERIFTIAVHIAMSLLLLWYIKKGKTLKGFVLVLFLHTLLDFTVVMLGKWKLDMVLIELIIFIVAVFSFVFIIKLKKYFNGDIEIPFDEGEKAVKEGY